MKTYLVILFSVACISLLAQDAQPCTSVVTLPGVQNLQHVVPDGTGGAIVAWQDLRNGADYDVYAQRIDAYGNMLWAQNGNLICGFPQGIMGNQGHLCITPSGPDFIIAWEDTRVNMVNTDIFAQKIDINGNSLWPIGGVPVCLDIQVDQFYPQICEDGAGGAFITWFDNRFGLVAPDYDVYAEWMNTAGVPAAPPTGILVSSSPWSVGTQQTIPVICTDKQGGAIIAWESVVNGIITDIYAQGLACIPFFRLAFPLELPVCTTQSNALFPHIVNDQPGGAIVCWEDYRGGLGSDIYAQAILNGLTSWIPNGVALAPPGTGQGYSPTMVACGAGSAIIAWQEGMSPNLDIMAQKVTAGVLSWFGGGMPALVCVAPGDQVFPQACPDGGNGIIIVWEDRRDIVTPSYDIYGEQLDTNGIIQGATPGLGTAICTFSGNQAGPMLANNLINQAIYVWVDGRTFPATNWDLFTLDPIDPTLPVVLSSFTATPTAANYAQINWITQSETNISGFYIHRNTEPELSSALSITELILGTNSSQQVNYSYTDEEVMAGATYYYWLQSVEYGGHMEYYGPATLTLPDNGNIHGTPEIPLQTGIKTIYPNPFNPQATVSFGIQEAGNVNLTVYNIKGEKVKSIYNGYLEKGTYRCLWNGKDEANTNCSSGIYCVRMTSAAGISNKKVVLSK